MSALSREPESTVRLIERARAGDELALGQLFARHLKPLQRWASGRLPKWARSIADTEYLTREIAGLRMNLGEVATRDWIRSELQDMLKELEERQYAQLRAELRDGPHPREAGPDAVDTVRDQADGGPRP